MRPNIFIASSTEALPVAHAVKLNFDEEADVDIWNENIFKLNVGYLDTLLNRAGYYDFCIAIFSADDPATVRKKKIKTPRDNVVFEFGLFLGRLGPSRTFFLIEEGAELFSDWSGIATASFKSRENMVAAVGAACFKIREAMKATNNLKRFTMLPSTSLAIGYYHNFLKRVFEAFEHSDQFKVYELDQRGKVKEDVYKIINRRPTIEVRVPERLRDLELLPLKVITSNYTRVTVRTTVRDFQFYISGDFGGIKRKDPKFTLFDIPTTLLASREAITHIFDEEFLATENIESRLERREIANFEKTLRILLPDTTKHQFFRFSVFK